MSGFWAELKQRRVVRVTIAYAVVAYAVVQGMSTFAPALHLPDWTVTLVAVLALIGLPLTIVLAWIFQVTPAGVMRTPNTRERPVTAGAIAVVGAIVVLAGAGGAFLFLPKISEESRAAAGNDRKRVLVAVFEDKSGDPALSAVGSMAADWLTQGLIQASIGEVVDRSALGEATVPTAPIALARALGAGTVIDGSYYKQGDTIYIRARLVDANTGDIKAALEPVSASVGKPVQAIEQLRARVLSALASELEFPELRSAPMTGRPPTYEAYRTLVESKGASATVRGAALSRAIELDTTFDQARIRQITHYAMMREPGRVDSVIAVLEARRARLTPLERAMFDQQRAFAHADLPESYAAAKRAAELAPGLNSAALQATHMNYPREALAEAERVHPAVRARSFDAYYGVAAAAQHMLGEYRQEEKLLKRARADHKDESAQLMAEARNLAALGRPEEALARIVQLAQSQTRFPIEYLWLQGLELRAHGHSAAADSAFALTVRFLDALPAELRIGARRPMETAVVHIYAGHDQIARMIIDSVALTMPERDSAHVVGPRGYLAARRGERAEAERVLAALQRPPLSVSDDPFNRITPYQWAACIAAELGLKDQALALLRGHARFSPLGGRWPPVHIEPCLDPLRGWKPFDDFIRPTR